MLSSWSSLAILRAARPVLRRANSFLAVRRLVRTARRAVGSRALVRALTSNAAAEGAAEQEADPRAEAEEDRSCGAVALDKPPLEVNMGPFHIGASACGVSKSAWRRSWRRLSVLEELIHAGEDSGRKLGDDAFAFCVAPSSQLLMGAVADGVSEWHGLGGDPVYVSHQLMALVRREVSALPPDHGPVSAFNVLSTAYKNLKAKPRDENGKEYAGSTTAVVGVVQYDPVPSRLSFNAINVGDSSLVIVRGGREAMMEVTRHGSTFSAPTQLALIPQAMQGQGFCDDRPEDGVIDKGDLERGDVLIFASDGVLDNLEVHTIGEIVRRTKESKGTHARSAGEISRALLLESQRGPKVDDMTVLVLAIDK